MEQKIIFNADDVDITSIMEQIHAGLKKRGYDIDELKRLGSGITLPKQETLSEGSSARMTEIMTNVNLTNTVQYWWQIPTQGGITGKLRVLVNKIVRKLSYFYLKHTFDQQNIYNANVTLALTELSNRLTSAEKQLELISDENRRLKEEKDNFKFNYFDFESKYRGTREEIKARQTRYLNYFEGNDNILDIGCGRGEFLELLSEHGIKASGVDLCEKNIECCKLKNIDALLADGINYLESVPDDSLGGIFSAQVIEHLSTEQLIHLVRLAHKKLKTGAHLVLETLNPQCLMIYSESFYMDPSHNKPVHPLSMRFIAQNEGFTDNELIYLTPTSGAKLAPATDTPEDVKAAEIANGILFGHREYALVATK